MTSIDVEESKRKKNAFRVKAYFKHPLKKILLLGAYGGLGIRDNNQKVGLEKSELRGFS